MLKRFALVLVALAALTGLGGASSASAEERFALVVGNSNYQSVAALPNPVNDAKAVSAFLESAGFEVDMALDLSQSDMMRAVQDFADKLADKGEDTVAMAYFGGHGAQIDGENYLLPVDAKITREEDVALAGVRLADLMNKLNALPSKIRIVILDACRNNPFEAISKSTGRGLAIVNAPAGTVVAYSTSPGATAEDGSGDNSPFATALIDAGKKPGAPIEAVLQSVRLTVHKATKGLQTPWEVTALTEPFQFFPGQGGDVLQPAPDRTEAEWKSELRSVSPRDAYDLVVTQDKVVVYQIFVDIYADTSWGRRILALLDRRLEMEAWFDAVTLNTAAAFQAFLKRYPDSDLAPTAKKLTERARSRSIAASDLPGALDVPATGEVKTVVNEVVKEVRVPLPPEIKTVTQEVIKEVPFEVVKEVKVPVVKEVVKVVKVPVVKEVVKVVKVPVIREVKVPVVREVKVPVIKIVTVPRHCPKVKTCGGDGGGGRGSSGQLPQINQNTLNNLQNLQKGLDALRRRRFR